MKVVITEGIIRNALNESIDDFLIEEGAFDAVRDWSNRWGLNNIGNAVNNAIASYMDWRTNGNWNRKYNITPKGKGLVVGNLYTKKWFEKNYNRLYEIVYGEYYGNRQYFYTYIDGKSLTFQHNWRENSYILNISKSRGRSNEYAVCRLTLDNSGNPYAMYVYDYNGNRIDVANSSPNKTDGSYEFNLNNDYYRGDMKVYSAEDNTTPEEYIAKYCNYNNFDRSTQHTLQDGTYKSAVKKYLDEIQTINNGNINAIRADRNYARRINYNYIIGLFTMKNFYLWWIRNYKNIKNNNSNNNTNNSNNRLSDNNYYSNNTTSQPQQSEKWTFKFDPNIK